LAPDRASAAAADVQSAYYADIEEGTRSAGQAGGDGEGPAGRGERPARSLEPRSLAGMMLELSGASWETIGRRAQMMAQGTCSPAEYRRMTQEKVEAFRRSTATLARSRKLPAMTTLLAPWHGKAMANAKRLRRRRSR